MVDMKSDNPLERLPERVSVRVRCPAFGFAQARLPTDPDSGRIFVATVVDKAIGTEFLVSLRNPETGEQIETVCIVEEHTETTPGRPTGITLKFKDPDQYFLDGLRRIILAAASTQEEEEREQKAYDKEVRLTFASQAELGRREAEQADGPDNGAAIGEQPLLKEYEPPDDDSAAASWPNVDDEPIPKREVPKASETADDTLIPEGIRLRAVTNLIGTVNAVLQPNAPEGGLFLVTTEPIPSGTAVMVELANAVGTIPIRAICQSIGEVNAASGDQVGVDLVFMSVPPPVLRELRELIAALTKALSPSPLADKELTPTLSPEELEKRRQEVRTRMEQAVIAERSGHAARAIDLLLGILSLEPEHAADLHHRIARLALNELRDLEFARFHARRAEELAPGKAEHKKLLETLNEKAAIKPQGPPKPGPSLTRRRERSGARVHLLLSAAAALLIIGLGVGWVVWRHILPRGTPPTVLNTDAFADIAPIRSVRLYKQRLYVKMGDDWAEMSALERAAILQGLSVRAERLHGTSAVFAIGKKNEVVGSHYRDEITLTDR